MEKDKKRRVYLYLMPLIVAGALFLDILTKYLVKSNLPFGRPVEIIGNFLRFTFVYNEGITFGMLSNIDAKFMPLILSLTAFIALGVVTYFYKNLTKFIKDGAPQNFARIAIMFIIGGALGNIIDRMFLFNTRADGSVVRAVVDFLDVGFGNLRWYVFNVADSFVVSGSIILGILFIFFEKKEKTQKNESKDKNHSDNDVTTKIDIQNMENEK